MGKLVKPRGAWVRDADGTVICRVANPIQPLTFRMVSDFTDWRISIPLPGEPIHPAILKFMESEAT